MKVRLTILAFSLAANAMGVWLVSQRTAEIRNRSTAAAASAVNRESGAKAAPSTPAQVRKLSTADCVFERDRLLAAGIPPEMVQAAVRAWMAEPRLSRERAFYAAAANRPWWQGGLVTPNITPDQHRELRELQKLEQEEIARVLGTSALVSDADRERYEFLPREKAERLALLERDYDELNHPPNPSAVPNAEQQRLIKAEYERDLAALLTPEELAQLQDRNSMTANGLSFRFEHFAGTDDEYRRFFEIQKAFDDRFRGRFSAMTAVDQEELNAKLKDMFGPLRYAEFVLSQRSEYRALVDLQRRHAIPQPAFEQIARLQSEVMTQANALAEDSSIDREQKKMALANLATHGRATVRATLGDELGNTFLQATGASWVDLLEQGTVYASYPGGGSMTRNVTAERRVAPPGAASSAPTSSAPRPAP